MVVLVAGRSVGQFFFPAYSFPRALNVHNSCSGIASTERTAESAFSSAILFLARLFIHRNPIIPGHYYKCRINSNIYFREDDLYSVGATSLIARCCMRWTTTIYFLLVFFFSFIIVVLMININTYLRLKIYIYTYVRIK